MRFPARYLPVVEIDGAEMKGEVYFSPKGIPFRRVSVWGVVVRRFVGEKSVMLIIDDLTGTIPVILLDDLREVELNEGDVVRVIGMVRERDGEKRIIAEIIRKIDTEEEVIHRLKNVLTILRRPGEEGGDVEVVEEDVEVVDLL